MACNSTQDRIFHQYLVFHFSARLSSRAEHHALDAVVKGLPGVRILL